MQYANKSKIFSMPKIPGCHTDSEKNSSMHLTSLPRILYPTMQSAGPLQATTAVEGELVRTSATLAGRENARDGNREPVLVENRFLVVWFLGISCLRDYRFLLLMLSDSYACTMTRTHAVSCSSLFWTGATAGGELVTLPVSSRRAAQSCLAK